MGLDLGPATKSARTMGRATGPGPMSLVLRPLSYVPCPISYVICPMSYVLCPVSYDLWPSDSPYTQGG